MFLRTRWQQWRNQQVSSLRSHLAKHYQVEQPHTVRLQGNYKESLCHVFKCRHGHASQGNYKVSLCHVVLCAGVPSAARSAT